VGSVFLILLSKAIASITGMDGLDSFSLVVAVCGIPVMVSFFMDWLIGRSLRGSTLLDCGQHPNQADAIMCVILCALGVAIAVMGTMSIWFRIEFLAISVATAIQCQIIATGRLQIRESGIWQYSRLLSWGRIESFAWAKDSTLSLTVWRGFAFSERVELPIPTEHIETVSQLLQEHCATWPEV
jgi:hypothetical protein